MIIIFINLFIDFMFFEEITTNRYQATSNQANSILEVNYFYHMSLNNQRTVDITDKKNAENKVICIENSDSKTITNLNVNSLLSNGIEKEIDDDEEKMKDKIEIPEILVDNSEEIRSNYLLDEIVNRYNKKLMIQKEAIIEENYLLFKIMNVINWLTIYKPLVYYVDDLCHTISEELYYKSSVNDIEKGIKELCKLLPEWGNLTQLNGKEIFRYTAGSNKGENRAKLQEIIRKRIDEIKY